MCERAEENIYIYLRVTIEDGFVSISPGLLLVKKMKRTHTRYSITVV